MRVDGNIHLAKEEYLMRPIRYLKTGVLVALLLLVGVTTDNRSPISDAQAYNNQTYDQIRLFSEALSIVQRNYVEEPESQELVRGAIKGMLTSLDPHSSFMNPDMYKEMQIDTQGEFQGIGITIGTRDGILTVISPIDDTPRIPRRHPCRRQDCNDRGHLHQGHEPHGSGKAHEGSEGYQGDDQHRQGR